MITVAGILLAIAAMVVATMMDGNSFSVLVGPSSFVLVFFGTVGIAIAGADPADLRKLPKAFLASFTAKPADPDEVVTLLMRSAEIARRQGVLALEGTLADIENPFVRTGLQQVVDGLDADTVRAILEIEIEGLEERHGVMLGLFRGMGGYAPTMGMLGTVVGLINMLGQISDPSQLGGGMALALLTTLYGVVLANVVFLPVAAKLTRLHDKELAGWEMALDGILALQAGATPRTLVDRLEAYLPQDLRRGYQERNTSNQIESGSGEEAVA